MIITSTLIFVIVGLIVLRYIIPAILQAIWEVIEIPYRVLMITYYSLAYVIITAWEVTVWILRLPNMIRTRMSS